MPDRPGRSDRDGRSLLARGPQMVVVKRGSRGVLLVSEGAAREIPAYHVPVLDTTCAGDAFAAGFLAGLAEGWPVDAAPLGDAAALATTQPRPRRRRIAEQRWLMAAAGKNGEGRHDST